MPGLPAYFERSLTRSTYIQIKIYVLVCIKADMGFTLVVDEFFGTLCISFQSDYTGIFLRRVPMYECTSVHPCVDVSMSRAVLIIKRMLPKFRE